MKDKSQNYGRPKFNVIQKKRHQNMLTVLIILSAILGYTQIGHFKCVNFIYSDLCVLQCVSIGVFAIYQRYFSNDTDGQCPLVCPDGWVRFQDSCYFLGYELKLTFVEAEHFCQQHHAHLVNIETAIENAFVKDFIGKTKADYVWLGLTDMDIEGVWRWYSNNNIVKFTDWYPGEPAGNGPEDCAVMREPTNTWQDYSCSRTYHPFCERNMDNEIPDIVG